MRIIAFLIMAGLCVSATLRAETIAEADLLEHIEILASDAFEGREPGTAGENKAVNYIATQWSRAGLRAAGEKGSWYAPVALLERTPDAANIRFSSPGRRTALRLRREEIILRSREASFHQAGVPVVFAGYAQGGSEQERAAVGGKLVILPQTAPGHAADSANFRQRKTQLIEAGALAVISIVADQGRWMRSLRRYQRGATGLQDADDHAAVEGLISFNQFRRLLQPTGLAAEKLLSQSADIDVTDLGWSADVTVKTTVRRYMSHNVIGKIAGQKPDSGALLFLGHWDHFGICRNEDPLEPGKDRICNGAIDNASGISLLIEAAKRLSGSNHDRDIYFLATTAEEKGLLGARAFVQDPPVALDRLEAVFNADTVALSDDRTNIAAIGLLESGLREHIELVAQQQGREIDRSGYADAYLKRQDGYVFVERDIPALMITSAFADKAKVTAYLEGPYHDVSDEVNDSLLLAGAAADANFHVALGRYFASTATYPGKATSGAADN